MRLEAIIFSLTEVKNQGKDGCKLESYSQRSHLSRIKGDETK